MPAPAPSSLIDRVDDTDQPVGVVRRQDVFRLGVGFRVVHILVQNDAGQLLLQQVGESRERSPLRWGSSVAGYLFSHETYVEAARRRGAEEIGLHVPLVKLGSIRMPDQGATKFISLFHARAESAEIKDPSHIQALTFWDIPALDQFLKEDPGAFTETFPIVYRLFKAATGR